MQNFTIGRKGLNWFLFAFILFVGNLSSYGQTDCPESGDFPTTQDFCYLSTIDDLDTDGYPVYQTDDNENDDEPIPADEILTNSTTYYVGGNSGNCSRIALTVNVTAAPVPNNTMVPNSDSFSISPCSNDGFTAEDLADFFEADPGYSIEVYTTEFGSEQATGPLTPGGSYFVGQVSADPDQCPSRRAAVGYDPNDPEKPTATSPQTFCQGATVADLEANGTYPNTQAIRWYRSANAVSPLSGSTKLINGQTYYATQVVNDRNSVFPPCESEERTAVQVNLVTADAGTNNSETLCENQVEDEGIFDSVETLEAYFLSLLGTDDDSGSFSNESLATLRDNYLDGIDGSSEDFTTTYEVDNGFCPVESATATLTVTAAESANAGTAVTTPPYCTSDDPIILSEIITGGDPSGVFSSDDADVSDGTLDPSGFGGQTIRITYTVSPETSCVSNTDTETFDITINETPNPGPGGEFSFCQAEFEAIIAAIIANPTGKGVELLNELDDDIDSGGDFFNDDLATLIAKYQAATFPETFTTTYLVNNAGCIAQADYSITITPNEPVNAGGNQNADPVCTTDGIQNLNDYLGSEADSGGEFSSTDITIFDGMFFDPSAEVPGNGKTVTYTVNSDDDICLTGSDSATITFDLIEGIEAGEPIEETICVEGLEDDFFTENQLTSFIQGLLEDGVPNNGSFNPEIIDLIDDYNNGSTELTTVYTLDDAPCNDSVEITLILRDNIEASLTDVENPAPVCENSGILDLTDFIGSNPDFGRFEGYPNGTFDPGAEGEGVYTIEYTLDEEAACVTGSATISFDLTIEDSANAGNGTGFEVCTDQDPVNLFERLESLNDNADSNGTFSLMGETLDMGMFDPSDYTPGQYEAIYTVSSFNDCGSDESIFRITVSESPEAGEGNSNPEQVCGNLETFDLFTLIDSDADIDGDFTINGEIVSNGQIQPTNLSPDDYIYIYTVNNGDDDACTDTATFSITITDAADAGMDMDLSICMNAGVQNLFDALSADADTNGEFTLDGAVIVDGMMNPADFAADEYEVIYTVPAINDCGEDTATFTITVEEAPGAPTVDGNPFDFCATDGATVADLSATGTNLTYYSDADLSMMVMAEDELMTGTYYVTQRNDDGACESQAAQITVNINDADTPSISTTTQEFCEYDDATVGDLTDQINETGTITWYDSADGSNSLSEGTPLQDGTIYYATLFNVETGCESSVRLAVTVELTDCPLLFPEGFSPNGDGLNDTFDIENIEDEYPNYTIEIFNRWGDSVYKGNANTPDWDGYSSDSSLGDDVLPVGVYFYYLNFNDGSTEPRRGKVYLSR